METENVTRLLRRMGGGDGQAAEDLHALLYEDLHRRARGLMRSAQQGHTLQPTAVVHEAWMKLARGDEVDYRDRSHFLAVACRAMRMVLVDHARARGAAKRGGSQSRELLDDAVVSFEERAFALVDLDDALGRLGEMDESLAKIVELRFFGGLTIEDAALVLGTSTSTVERGWRTARAWLRKELGDAGADDA